jgi:hypothetical protein
MKLPASADPEEIFAGFLEGLQQRQLTLYPAQEEAVLELLSGNHVILGTPTGSGKSLVATALHYKGLAEGRRSVYTCPIKALVSEKFFALCHDFGAEQVGMLTGDASINPTAPILCCTAEILANMAVGGGSRAAIDYVVMDEFHYYADPDRGVAWQLPLLTMPDTTFLLMSATLGDCTPIEASLTACTRGRKVVHVRSASRPVPLDFTYQQTPLHETLTDLLAAGKAPIYVVNFSQRECVLQAQNALSIDFCSKPQKAAIAAELQNFRFDSPFGKEMRRFVGHGIGLHHAGLLPKYRLLVEKLTQSGALKLIMGTDTLGVGVNVPIRTVLFTKLSKYNGVRSGLLGVREFHQIAGRAGRRGFDTAGSVVVQAPVHVIENARAESRVADNPAKKRKLVKKKPPPDYVPYTDQTLQTLIQQPPEPLPSRFVLSFGLLLTVLQSHPDAYAQVVRIIGACHDSPVRRGRHRRQAAQYLRTLRQAGLVLLQPRQPHGSRLSIHADLPEQFSLNQSLGLYLLDTLPELDPQDPDYALDVLSLVEAIAENPGVVLAKQVDRWRGERLAELKAAGMDYDERMIELEKVTYPKPKAEFIYASFNAYAAAHPWVGNVPELAIRPKSIAREIYEGCTCFADYVRDYGLQRSEGVLLRYLSGIYRSLRQSVPNALEDERLLDVVTFFRTMLGRVDSSLLAEWTQLLQPVETATDAATSAGPPGPADLRADPRALRSRLRTECHRLVKALSRADYAEAAACLRGTDWDAPRLEQAMQPYLEAFGSLLADPRSRQGHHTHIKVAGPQRWQITQALCDPEEASDWAIHAYVNWEGLQDPELPLIELERIGD